jgi:hypothetical protein
MLSVLVSAEGFEEILGHSLVQDFASNRCSISDLKMEGSKIDINEGYCRAACSSDDPS